MSKTVVITGANRGIGLSFCKFYEQLGNTVYALCRKSSDELSSLGVNVIEGIEVGNGEVMDVIRQALQDVDVDILINNAGILRDEKLGELDFPQIGQQFAVNALGPLRVVEALLDNLTEGAKIGLVTSRMGSIEDNTSGGRYGYRMSKVALNIAGVSLAHDLKSQGVSVGIYHPGLVATEMIGGHGDITPDEAAIRLIQRIEELNLKNSGTFWHSSGDTLPW